MGGAAGWTPAHAAGVPQAGRRLAQPGPGNEKKICLSSVFCLLIETFGLNLELIREVQGHLGWRRTVDTLYLV